MTSRPSSPVIRLWRFVRLGLHLAGGTAIAGWVFPWVSSRHRRAISRHWSRHVLRILNIRLEVHGEIPDHREIPGVLLANHVSWLDIVVLNAVFPARFVAKAEVRSWPVVGWLAAKVGTLFIERGAARHAARLNGRILEVLIRGEAVAVFPEGTTSEGDQLRPFRPALLAPAIHARVPVRPAAIRFHRASGELCRAAAFVGDIGFLGSLAQVLRESEMRVRVTLLPPIMAADRHRREIAQLTREAIAGALGINVDDNLPGTPADPQDAPPIVAAPTDSRCPSPVPVPVP